MGNEATRTKARWGHAAIIGGAVGAIGVAAAVAFSIGGDSRSCACADPRAGAAPSVVAPSTPGTTPPASEQAGNVATRTITVTGQGSATVEPDIATVQLGVSVQKPSAGAALQQANQSAAALIDALKAAGVADDDIVTSNLSIWPQYDIAQILGYTASNTVSVKVRDISRTGPVIDAAAGAAGDDIAINGISFGLDDPEQAMGAARADAIANAAERAGEFAQAAGVSVGAVLQISEATVTPYVPTISPGAAAATTVAADAPTPIQPGTTDLSVTVTVVYALG